MKQNVTRNKKFITKIILLAGGLAIIIGVLLGWLGIYSVQKAYNSMTEEELRACAIQADSEFTAMWDGDWAYDNGVLTKGGQEVYDEYLKNMEELKSKTNIDYTIFFGDTRAVTTLKDQSGQYMINTQASAAVTDAVMGGADLYKTGLDIGGVKYSAYYTPLLQPDGSVVGMMFAGRASADTTNTITRVVVVIVGMVLAGLIAILIAGFLLTRTVSKLLNRYAEHIALLADGDLTISVDEDLLARQDELGTIAESIDKLSRKLNEVITASKTLSMDVSANGNELSSSSETASQASNQVSEAVDSVSKGAVSQAERVADSAENVNEMGSSVDIISDGVNALGEQTRSMSDDCNNSMDSLNLLLEQNENVTKSMKDIDDAIKNTAEAVSNISESTNLISDIASQTNLLALNASIEAARAGEAGRGFAVVAEEIGKLADQSATTASGINEVVKKLIEESEISVKTIQKLNEALSEQSKQIDDTKQVMTQMREGVSLVSESTGEISEKVNNLGNVKNNLMSITEDLSAISEQNAAAMEETNASMEELNATFEIINQNASSLKDLAGQLNEEIQYFKTE